MKPALDLTLLNMLKLEHNRLTDIQANVFHDLNRLNSLNIEHSNIKNVFNFAYNGLEGQTLVLWSP